MTKDIREAAQALLQVMEKFDICLVDVRRSPEYTELKAALKPSKSEVAEYLESEVRPDYGQSHIYQEWIDFAIEYLREESDNA